jgi:hypothetical protein
MNLKNNELNKQKMETFDFSKYVGTYTVEEAKQVCKQMEKEILEARKREAIKKAHEKFGNNFNYEVKRGVSIDVTKLKDGQKVCRCDVKGHYILMTEIRVFNK